MKTKSRVKTKLMGREAFISALEEKFPEVIPEFMDISEGLLHCEMADFRRVVETAMDDGKHWQAQLYLEFVESCLEKSDESLENAILVSFVEDFALGEVTEQRKTVVHERMPKRMRNEVIDISENWA